jgi:hypothetical protein
VVEDSERIEKGKIFGFMKQWPREQFNALFIRDWAGQPGMPEALEYMISVWKRFQ